MHDRHGDSALLAELLVEGRDDQYVILVESHTDPDPDAEYRWPFYAAYLHDKYQCPVVLLVVTSKKKTARWARKPIADPDIAEGDSGFGVFSAITHSRSHQIDVILETLAGALSTVDEETGSLLAEFTEAGLGILRDEAY